MLSLTRITFFILVVIFIFPLAIVRPQESTDSKNVDQGKREIYQKWLDEQNQEKKKIQEKLPDLIVQLKTGTHEEKQHALDTIRMSDDRRVVQPLIELLDNLDDFKNYTPIQVLYTVVQGCKDDPEFQKNQKDTLIEILKKRQNEKNEDNSVFLYLLDDTEDAFANFKKRLNKGDWSCIYSIYVNGINGPNYVEEKAKPVLLDALNMSPIVEVKSANALMTLKDFKNRSDLVNPVFDAMKKVVWDSSVDEEIRANALLALEKIHSEIAKNEIKKISKTEKNRHVKYTANAILMEWDRN